jgi:hypothetical protein
MPLAVKLLALGVALLGAVYGLTLLRDHKDTDVARSQPGPETQAALVAPSLAPIASAVPETAVAAAPDATQPSAIAAASAPARTPTMPTIANRVKSLVATIQSRNALTAQPDASAGKPSDAAAALIPPAPSEPAVK